MKQKGITLVSLVVTTIILIILAGVSINLIIGQDGIITKAKQAKENMEIAVTKEQERLNELYSQMMIATNDDSQITISIKDLNKIIDERVEEKTTSLESQISALQTSIDEKVEEKTASLKSQVSTLQTSTDNIGKIYSKGNTINISDTAGTWIDVPSATWTIPEGTWLIDIAFNDKPKNASSGLFTFSINGLGITNGYWRTDIHTPTLHFTCVKSLSKDTTGYFSYFQSIPDTVSRDLTVNLTAVRIK